MFFFVWFLRMRWRMTHDFEWLKMVQVELKRLKVSFCQANRQSPDLFQPGGSRIWSKLQHSADCQPNSWRILWLFTSEIISVCRIVEVSSSKPYDHILQQTRYSKTLMLIMRFQLTITPTKKNRVPPTFRSTSTAVHAEDSEEKCVLVWHPKMNWQLNGGEWIKRGESLID